MAAYADGLEHELEVREVGLCGEPGTRGEEHAAHFFRPDHLQRITEAGTALLLHLGYDDAAPTAYDEIELVPSGTHVRRDEAVPMQAIVAESAALAAIHAAS